MLASFRESLKAARIWLFHEHAFRVSHEQRKRFSIQAQYDANETFRNLLQWSGTTLEVLNSDDAALFKPISNDIIIRVSFSLFFGSLLRGFFYHFIMLVFFSRARFV